MAFLFRSPTQRTTQQMMRSFANMRGLTGGGLLQQKAMSGVGGLLVPRRTFTNGLEKRDYYWVNEEAEELIAKAYSRHLTLEDSGRAYPPSIGIENLEKLEAPSTFPVYTGRDRLAKGLINFLEWGTEKVFRERYDHHAVTLESVAAVPGMVGGFFRHTRSLRRLRRDHGWINLLLEEAENERMHLLIWLQHTKPTSFERFLVVLMQTLYVPFYATLYFLSPRTAHRSVGYLEEAAHRAYTAYLGAIDSGAIPNVPAGTIAKKYYRLPDDATLRDVVLHVRADEHMHQCLNHHLADKIIKGEENTKPMTMNNDMQRLYFAKDPKRNEN